MRSPLRILHVATGNLYGGVEVFLHTLARHQPPTVLADFTVCWGEGRLARQLRATGAQVHDLGEVRFSRPWQVWRVRRRLGAVLRRERFDVAVLHSGWTHLLFGPVLRRAGLPIVMGVHTLVPRHSRLERWARRIPLAGVFANSRFTAESARSWYPGCPDPQVILLPVESPATSGERASAALRESLRTPLGDCVILQASRMQSLKGQRTLLQALAAMRTVPRWTC